MSVIEQVRKVSDVIIREVTVRALHAAEAEEGRHTPSWGGPQGASALAANLLILYSLPRWTGFHPRGLTDLVPPLKEPKALVGLHRKLMSWGLKTEEMMEAYALAGAAIVGDSTMHAASGDGDTGLCITLYRGEKEVGFGSFLAAADPTHMLAMAIVGSINSGAAIDWTWGLTPERSAELETTRTLSFLRRSFDMSFSQKVLMAF